eukprot:TRINITY_DN9192_c0_g1_i8.p1 TRINITY_DN9192_c0_g1~~TRINITY_DN9192_c0_g1_i8.p1  ORF type:complete len:962 (-),score=314.50 TRINITY_DN9192_c0_g1_i8:328-3213(-)
MGKRKQKVRWSSVDGISWSCNDQASSSPDGSAGVVKGSAVPGSGGGTRRSSAQGWTSSLAPRFERKAAAEAEQKHIYYEGEFCEAEDLPNGFTKIRSKNLDILFKRDYYEQRLAAQQKISEELMKLKNSELKEEDSTGSLDEDPAVKSDCETNQTEVKENIMGSTAESDSTAKSCPWSFDQIDPNDIPEFKPLDSIIEPSSVEIDSGHTSPFYINHMPQEYETPPHPNLYLYSPSNNTLIPCEEIIIPNPVMSPEGPVYSGPTNIYLAYPVQGPDGKGYITQPFATPGSAGSYLSQDSASYSPSISYDGSNYYSSTPHTPNSGEDSGSSTQPTTPPPLVNFHPNNWTRDMCYTHQLPSNTEGYYDPQPMDKSTDKLNNINPLKSVPTKQSASPEANPTRSTVTYIPGLPLDSMSTTPKKTQKRRKKKTKTESSLSNCDSSNKESENLKISPSYELDNFQANYDQKGKAEECDLNAHVEPIHEIHLTDDLADSLVNPPTDPEASDEEETHQSKLKNQEALQKREDKEKTNEFFTETHVAENLNYEINEMEIEDKEICQITENIKEIIFVNEGIDNKNILLDHILEKCNIDSEQKAKENQEHKENDMECVNVPEVSVTSIVGQNKSFDNKIIVEGAINEEECEIGQNKEQLNGEDKIHISKNNINKTKKSKKSQNFRTKIESEFPKSENPILHQNKDSFAEIKKSYSSVIKSSLVKESNPNPTISSQPKVEIVPSPSPLPTTPNCPAVQSNTENCEKVPLAVSKHENWEKTPRKRKHRNKKIQFEDSPHAEEIPDLEIVYRIEESLKPQEVTKVLEEETVQEEENENTEQEKKKLRRRKKKHGSEGPEEINAAHRVVIRDDQIQIQPPGSGRRSSQVLSSSFLDTVNTSSHSDFMVISELGSGISRGCMNYGRLYQGKYIPPERTDGLLPECEEEESVNEEATIEEIICEDSCVTTSADIDLD